MLKLSWKLNKLRKKIEEKLIKPLFIKSQLFLKKETTINFQELN